MKVEACDICYTDGEHLVLAEVHDLRVDDIEGEIDLCAEHRVLLQEVLTQFFEVARVASGEGIKRCRECSYTSVSQGEMNKHQRKHDAARSRQQEMHLPPALAATG